MEIEMTDRIADQAYKLGLELRDRYALPACRSEVERWHRAYQIVAMGLAVSVVVNIVAIFWR
jgi:hypothetical protein